MDANTLSAIIVIGATIVVSVIVLTFGWIVTTASKYEKGEA